MDVKEFRSYRFKYRLQPILSKLRYNFFRSSCNYCRENIYIIRFFATNSLREETQLRLRVVSNDLLLLLINISHFRSTTMVHDQGTDG